MQGIQGTRGAEVPLDLDTQWTFRKGVEGEMVVMVMTLQRLYENVTTYKRTENASRKEVHRRCGRLIRLGDALQDATLESSTQRKECTRCGKTRGG